MTRKICCNPLKHHKKQYLKDLNPVSATAISTGLVNEGDLICSGCRKKLFEKLKPKKTVENSECDSSRAAPQPINEEVASDIQPNEEADNEIQPSNEVAAADIQPSNGVAAADIQPPMEKSPFLNPRSQQRSSLFMRIPFLRNRWMKMMFSQLQIVRSQPLAKAR